MFENVSTHSFTCLSEEGGPVGAPHAPHESALTYNDTADVTLQDFRGQV